jgi:hypothetical protein
MASDVQALLKKMGPTLTSDLIAALVKNGLSETAARKRVQRAQGLYQRLAGLRFEKNARFIYLPEQYGASEYWEKLEEACRRSGKSYWSAISMLKARGGIVPLEQFPRITGAPAARKGQLSSQRILERLTAVNVLEEVAEADRQYIQFHPGHYHRDSLAQVHANEIAEIIALQGIKDWARRIGFGSYGKFRLRGEDPPPVVSGITWDLAAPSYVRPLVSVQKGVARQGFFVCDIHLRDTIGHAQAEAIVRKCDLAAAPVNVPPIMPMIVGHVFSTEALDLLKGKGILAVSLRNLFGEELANALRDLVTMLTDFGARASVDPDHIRKVMDTLTKIEGAADNLRGALFELIIGSVVKDVEDGFLVTGERRQHSSGRKAEIDVRLDRGTEKGILVIECKAKNPSARVSEADIKRWYQDRVPLIYSILSNDGRYTEKPFRFELWTNGEFAASGITWLKEQPMDFGSHTIGWKDGVELKRYADRVGNASLRDMLNEHYFRSAMKKVV